VNAQRGIVVLPAIAGVNPYIHAVAGRLGAAGWATEIVDYFEGGAPPDLSSPEKILKAVAQVSDGRVLQQTREAIQRFRSRGIDSVGALGYCIGGSYALLAGASVDGLSAVANYYGGLRYEHMSALKPEAPLSRAADLRVPMIAHYGSADRFVPVAEVDTLEAALDASGKTFELFRYHGAPHAFDEDFRPSYRPVAASEAWARTLTFLGWYVSPRKGARGY
jgi:carboxymethylenebutenolidase